MTESTKCNLCGSSEYSVMYKTYKGDISDKKLSSYTITDNSRNIAIRIVRCASCGLIYVNPRAHSDILTNNYIDSIDHLYLEEEAGRRLSAKKIIKELKKFHGHGKLLDVGCAVGFLLDEAKKAGFDVYGVELSKWAADYAKNKLGISTVYCGSMQEAKYPANHFDIIILSDVIEHLTDPKGILIEIRKLLKPDGTLYINTPDINSLASRILRAKWWGVKNAHLYYFQKKTLNEMLKHAGFVPIKIRAHSRTFTIKYLVTKLADYDKTLYRIFSFLTNNALNGLHININLGDQIEVYSKKA